MNKDSDCITDFSFGRERENLLDPRLDTVVCPGAHKKRCACEFGVSAVNPGRVCCPDCGLKFKAKFNLK